MNKISSTIKNTIKEALESLDIGTDVEIELEHPAELDHGDYASNIAMQLAGRLDENPRQLAEQIVEEVRGSLPEDISSVEVAGPGFINFYLSPNFFAESIADINSSGPKFGSSSVGADATVVVEYSSPNIAKPFTVGHLRSTVIGDAVANILDFVGYEVVRDNHIGDWGTQFGKILYALEAWGDISEIENAKEPVKKLVDLYVRFHKEAEKDESLNDDAREWFARLEAGDKTARQLLDKLRNWSLGAFNEIYERLGVSFDTYHGESKFAPMVNEVITDLENQDLITEDQGAKLVFFKNDSGEELMPPLMIQKSDGTSIYAARDLATDKWRKSEYGEEVTIINEVGSEQSLYFKQLFETEQRLGYFPKDQRHHLAHGLFRFADRKMSTREGNVIWLEEIINEAVQRASEFNQDPDVAEAVGVGAIKYNDLKRDPVKDIVFSWDEVLNLEGDSGPYLQYTYARARSVLRKAETNNLQTDTVNRSAEVSKVEKLLYRFPEVVQRAADDRAPRYIATYLHEVGQAFNTFYGHTQIIDDSPEVSYRLALTAAAAQVLKNGLNLLGIKVPEEM